MTFFEINVLKLSNENPSIRLGAKAYIELCQRAAVRMENIERLKAEKARNSQRFGELNE